MSAPKQVMSEDEVDFYEATKCSDVVLARWVLHKIKAGLEPRDIAALLEYEGRQLQSWCVGRYARDPSPCPRRPNPGE